jgi:hypothetical protein
MPLPNIFRRASSYILGVQTGTPSPPFFTDGETIFCESFFYKNGFLSTKFGSTENCFKELVLEVRVTYINIICTYTIILVTEAVSRRLPTAVARIKPRSGHVGFVVHKVALGQVFSEYFSFPCQAFHRLLHTHHHLS